MNLISKFSIGIILCSAGIIFILLSKYFFGNETAEEQPSDSNLSKEEILLNTEKLEIALKQMITYEGLQIDSIWLMEEQPILLEEYAREKPVFVLFYPQHFCGECFQGDLYRFNDLAKEYKDQTILISTELSKRDLFFFKKEHDIQANVYPISTKQRVLFAEMKEPCFFILTPNKRIHLFFNPDPDYPDLSDWYFKKISSLLNKLDK